MKHAREDYNTIQEITTNGTTRKIPADEPVFLIRAQDVVGAAAVRAWAKLAEAAGAAADIIKLALDHADKMDAWPKKKVADVPTEIDPKVGAALGQLAKAGVSITKPRISKSYPFLSISKHHGVPYEIVLLVAQYRRSSNMLNQHESVAEEYIIAMELAPRLDLLDDIDAANREFARIQREGWD